MRFKKILAMAAFVSLIWPFLSSGVHADTIKMAAMNACPYNCDPETDGKKGFMVDIAERVFRKAGHTVVPKVLPFNRAVKSTVNGGYDAIAISNPNDSEKRLMPEVPKAKFKRAISLLYEHIKEFQILSGRSHRSKRILKFLSCT